MSLLGVERCKEEKVTKRRVLVDKDRQSQSVQEALQSNTGGIWRDEGERTNNGGDVKSDRWQKLK